MLALFSGIPSFRIRCTPAQPLCTIWTECVETGGLFCRSVPVQNAAALIRVRIDMRRLPVLTRSTLCTVCSPTNE
eukprot:3105430-Prymnesium_polylepis.3